MPIQETERLTLREFEPSDADFILRLLNEPTFIENIVDRGVRTREQAEAYLQGGPMASYRTHGHGLWCVVLKESGAPIGMCGLIKRDSFADVDLGYAFLPEHTGRGYATEAGAAALAFGRDTLRLPRVIAITKPGNARSAAVLTRLGFESRGLEVTPLGPEPEAMFRLVF
jgi:RimJ/RimL family protein N-acetyltransferase